MEDEVRSREEEARRAERKKILDRLNANDTGATHAERENEERRTREIATARERERRPEPGSGAAFFGG